MRGLRNKESSKWKKVAAFVFLLLVFSVLLNSLRNVYEKRKAAEETLVRMQKELADLQDRSKYLNNSINKIATKEGIEFEMRKKLNVAQAGESVAVLVDPKSQPTVEAPPISTWQKIKNFFTDIFK